MNARNNHPDRHWAAPSHRPTAQQYPPESAGRLMVSDAPIALATLTAGDVRRQLTLRAYEDRDLILVVDKTDRYLGAVPTADVLLAHEATELAKLVRRDWPAVPPELDQEHAVAIASRTGHAPLVVRIEDGRALGVVPVGRMLRVMAREHREDVHRLVGILKEREGAQHALDDPPLERVRRRLPWLVIGLILSSAGTAIMASYERALQAHVSIAFFIPSLVYIADAIGTQTEAIAVRGLSLQRRPLSGILAGEVLTGVLIGLILGVLAFIGVLAVFRDLRLALGIGVALTTASALASALGLALPWMMTRLGVDPAFGSGPIATIIQDVLTILIYFQVMTMLLTAG